MQTRLEQIVRAGWFHGIVIAAVVLAAVVAGVETHAGLHDRHRELLDVLNTAVLGVFVVELFLKLGAQGRRPWRYFQDGWNVFDFVVVVLCCLPADSQFAAVLRIGRGLRLLRLVTALPKLQLLVGALLRSLGAMGYVGLLLALMFYMYAVAGVHLLGPLDPVHFGSLPAALLSLFRVITLDNWSDLLRAVQAGAPLVSVAYFVSFILLGTMIMLNLFIGIIMNSMAEMHAEIAATERPAPTAPDRDGHSVALADDLAAFERDIEALRQQAARIRSRLTLTPAEGAFSHGNHPGKRD